jgi:hypothetical protein
MLVGNLSEAKPSHIPKTSWNLRTNKEHFKNLTPKIFKKFTQRGLKRGVLEIGAKLQATIWESSNTKALRKQAYNPAKTVEQKSQKISSEKPKKEKYQFWRGRRNLNTNFSKPTSVKPW